MRTRLWLVLSLLWIGGVSALTCRAFATDLFGYGTYTCVTQQLVGIVGNYAGTLRPETDKFLVIIEKIKREPWMCDPSEPRTYHWWGQCGAINQAVISKDKTPLNEFRNDGINLFLDSLGSRSFWLNIYGEYRLVPGLIYYERGTCQRMK